MSEQFVGVTTRTRYEETWPYWTIWYLYNASQPTEEELAIESEVTMTDWSKCAGRSNSCPAESAGPGYLRIRGCPWSALFGNLAEGATVHDFIEWFGGVDETQVRAVLEFIVHGLDAKVAKVSHANPV